MGATPEEAERTLQAAIDGLPRVELASVRPTPLEPLPQLTEELGGPDIYVKRDDLTGLAFGGNKTRMFEFALADALESNAETIVYGAPVQSNYCRQLAGACAKLGLDLELFLRPIRDVDHEEIQGNHRITRLCGADVTVLDSSDPERHQTAIAERVAELESRGEAVYRPRQAETIDLDALAYAETSIELSRQCRERDLDPDYLYLASQTTTQAGVELGFQSLGKSIAVRGFCPTKDVPGLEAEMARIGNQGAERIGLDVEVTPADFDNDDSFVGEQYGVPTEASLEAIRTAAETEGLLLDPVYTGKAMAGLFAHIREGRLDADDGPVIFLHTGGYPALFAFHDVLD